MKLPMFPRRFPAIKAVVLLAVAAPVPAFAHALFETPAAAQNSSDKAVIRIGHGCEGQDTHALKFPAPGIMIKAAPQKMAQADTHAGHGNHGAAAVPAASTGTMAVSTPWTRATPPGSKVAGGFLTIENKGTAEDRLTGASVDAAAVVEVHEMAMEAGVMKMRALDKGLAIPAGGKVELKPGGYHIMFIDLKRPIAEGETLKGELMFEKAGKVPVEFKAMGIGAKAGGHQHH